MKASREELLSALEMATPGLAPKELIEQSTCFVLQDGFAYAFNDETFSASPTKLDKSFHGAVPSRPLLEILRKLPDDELEVTQSESALVLRGKGGRRSEIRLEAEVLLPIESVETPKEWKPLHEEFCDAVTLVQECAGRDGEFHRLCVHLHPKWVEACDGVQLCRYKVSTKIKEKALVRRESVRHVTHLGMTEFSEGESWIHFRNPAGTRLSCRRYLEEYPNYTEFLDVTGETLDLPKGLEEALVRATIFLDEKEEEAKQVSVTLTPGKLRLKGQGVNGWYSETKKVQYTGKSLTFLASPVMLAELSKKHNSCQATESRLKVDGGKWAFVACLGQVEGNGTGEGEHE